MVGKNGAYKDHKPGVGLSQGNRRARKSGAGRLNRQRRETGCRHWLGGCLG